MRGGGPPGRGGGGGQRGRPTFEGFADQGDRHHRSPTPEDTIPISKRKRPFTAWDVKPTGFETFTPEQAKLTGKNSPLFLFLLLSCLSFAFWLFSDSTLYFSLYRHVQFTWT